MELWFIWGLLRLLDCMGWDVLLFKTENDICDPIDKIIFSKIKLNSLTNGYSFRSNHYIGVRVFKFGTDYGIFLRVIKNCSDHAYLFLNLTYFHIYITFLLNFLKT